ncbi:TFIIA-alpha and beta-like factor [Sorex araneus]|uniref:TFIIA-alpha and beta-like factor n=1 Tax=Sorex araneus TaxID=42254 RepID=UPI002433D814|nr:TFIIA-alpha and beta-like factor [Sorex araneus]
MAGANPVAKLYRSVIEDVIERVRDLFAEEGVEEQVLKDLKQLWETKVLQSKATEDFFRNSVHSPLFTLQLPHGLHQTLPSSTASLVFPAGRTLPAFTTTDLGTSNSSASFAFPGYPIHVPTGVTLQTASGHLYKVNVPVMVAQSPGRGGFLQPPMQPVFQQLGPPPVLPASVPRLAPCFLQAATEKAPPPAVLYPGPVPRKRSESASGDVLVARGSDLRGLPEGLLCQPEGPAYVTYPGLVFPPHGPHADPKEPGRQPALKRRMPASDVSRRPGTTQEPGKDSISQMDLSAQVDDNGINGIIQIDGAGDTSSNDEIETKKDLDDNEYPEAIDAGDLKVLEDEADSASNEDSTANSSDNEDPQIDIVEEDPLNSGDDVSEQDVPDLFDTENVIVCQYDKIHRNKNKWKFYLKDGVMCFEGRDYVFAKAIGDAEW